MGLKWTDFRTLGEMLYDQREDTHPLSVRGESHEAARHLQVASPREKT